MKSENNTVMGEKQEKYLFVEPYYGGSHKSFIQGLETHLDVAIDVLSLPARKWKMRMQLAAPYMAEKIVAKIREGACYDGVITSTFIDVGVLRSLLASNGILLPIAVYFHENQFAYPSRIHDPSMHQFTAINFTTALCADSLAFNSGYNRETFFSGIKRYLKKAADMAFEGTISRLEEKSVILYPGMDYEGLDSIHDCKNDNSEPVIVWNHRWEHDKDPEHFFSTLIELSREGKQFKLVVLGESFRDKPEIFSLARKELARHILHFGYAEDRATYYRWLKQGTIAVSTAVHEFFGLAMLEAVRAGCLPLVPDRLAYKEIFPAEYRYGNDGFKAALVSALTRGKSLESAQRMKLTAPYSWPNMSDKYTRWFQSLKKISAKEINTISAKNMVLRV